MLVSSTFGRFCHKNMEVVDKKERATKTHMRQEEKEENGESTGLFSFDFKLEK